MLLCRNRRPTTLRYLSFTPDVKRRNHVLAEVALTGSVNARVFFYVRETQERAIQTPE